MKKIVLGLLILIVFALNEGEVFAYNDSIDSNYIGTIYENSTVNDEYLNNVVINIKTYNLENNYIDIYVDIIEESVLVQTHILGTIHFSEFSNMIYFDLNSYDDKLSVVAFYIELNAATDFMHPSHLHLENSNVIRMVFSYNGNLYFFEDQVEGLFLKIADESRMFIENTSETVDVLSYMPFWFYDYPNSSYKQIDLDLSNLSRIQPRLLIGNLDELEDGSGGIPIDNSGLIVGDSVPNYVYEKIQYFKSEGEAFYTYDDYIIFKKTRFLFTSLVSSIVVLKVLKTIPPDSRYDVGHEVGFELKLIDHASYNYITQTNSIYQTITEMHYYIDQINIALKAIDDDIAWSSEAFTGISQYDSSLTKLAKLSVGVIPYVGHMFVELIEISQSKYNDFFIQNTYESQLYTQVSKGIIHKEIIGESGDFRLYGSGDKIRLSGHTTYKDFLSITGYKYILVKLNFDVHRYHDEDIEATYSDYTQITYYR